MDRVNENGESLVDMQYVLRGFFLVKSGGILYIRERGIKQGRSAGTEKTEGPTAVAAHLEGEFLEGMRHQSYRIE